MQRMHWIVVGIDFSEAAQRALAYAVDVASYRVARIALVHAYEDGADPEELRARLDDAIARSAAPRLGVHVEPVLRRGSAWDKLKNVATELGADSIVIGTGSMSETGVTTRVLTSARRSVLVVSLRDPQAP